MSASVVSVPAAFESLYAAFSDVPRPAGIASCPCCCTEAEAEALLAPGSVRELSADTLRPYAAHVLATVGGVADFQYFLPRILEIACRESFNWPDLEVVTGRLWDAEWLTAWPTPRRDAVRGVLWAVWRRVLSAPAVGVVPELAPDVDVDTALAAIARAETDIAPYLDHWTEEITGEQPRLSAGHLREFLHHHVRHSRDGGCRRTRSGSGDSDSCRPGWVATAYTRPSPPPSTPPSPELLEVLADVDGLLRS